MQLLSHWKIFKKKTTNTKLETDKNWKLWWRNNRQIPIHSTTNLALDIYRHFNMFCTVSGMGLSIMGKIKMPHINLMQCLCKSGHFFVTHTCKCTHFPTLTSCLCKYFDLTPLKIFPK